MSQIPWLIVGLDKKLLRELCGLWLTKLLPPNDAELSEETQNYLAEERKKARQALANHRVRDLILEEIEIQLKFFMEFADKRNQETIVKKYEALFELISSLRNEAMPLSPEEIKANENDGVFNALREELPKLFSGEIIS